MKFPVLAAVAGAIAAIAWAQTAGIPAHGPAVVLFDGTDLSHFDTFSPSRGLNNDRGYLFSVENGAIHVSGEEYGFLITKEDYENYYLSAEFKWGEATHPPRVGKARDAGILYDVTGPMTIWPSSVEFQMQEGATGDIYLCNGFALTSRDGRRITGKPGQYVGINRIGKGEWKDVTGFRDPNGDPEKPHGEWNQVELVVQGDHVTYYVNGKLVNEASQTVVTGGKIIFQSEGAEVWYRNIRLYPLT
ncbi:MAG TPA: DUF1080 domain-containing protein [Bryobacteraceae bacterium]|nr:DUF1080 domain-containing protein [Bryobacteraceae bacterium]